MTEIKREAGDKTKGFTLQKQRALGLFFEEIKLNPNVCVNVAIEFKGDVFLQKEKTGYIEEQKNYDNLSTFSFNSHQILNTLVYFLEIWISEGKSESLKFGFYSTNKIGKESNTDRTVELGIILPKKPILELLSKKTDTEEEILIETVKKYLIDEYRKQYKKDITLELDDESTVKFLNSINWFFEQNNENDYENEIIEKIKKSEFSENLKTYFDAHIVYASLMLALEKKQDEKDPILKFLRKESVENIFLKVGSGQQIDKNAYKYINYDFSELSDKVAIYLLNFLKSKYYSNVKDKTFPELILRKVAKHNNEVKITRENLEQSDPEKTKHLQVIIKEIGDLINSERPTFLFGEIGSGKSTLLAHYFLNDIKIGIFPIFIPSSYLKGKIRPEIQSFKEVINIFVNQELSLENKFFDLETVLFTKKEITLIIDGLDEFDRTEAQKLLHHLLNLSNSFINLRIIASGRPIELQEIVNFNEWNCLTTLDLTENEVKQILMNEAVASSLTNSNAEIDSEKRFRILQTKQELYSIATTPLIVCLLRDFLVENVNSKTLGDILYEVLKKRLIWNVEDKKENFEYFLNEFPNPLQREIFISQIAYKIYESPNGTINDDELFQLVNSKELIPLQFPQRARIVNDAINFFINNFLQKIGSDYTFQSHQLFQFSLGLHLFTQKSFDKEFNFKSNYINDWRVISFSGSIARRKSENFKMQIFFKDVLNNLLISKNNTPAAAVLLAEIQNTELNKIFLSKIKSIGFRPLMFWNHTDSIVPHAYGYILKDVGKEGFNWLFENYLNPKHPSRIGMDDVGISVLRYYLFRSNFNLSIYEKQKLCSIIPFHIAAHTYSCDTLFPTLAIAIPEKFETNKRCILLAKTLDTYIVSSRSEELLIKECEIGNKEFVLQGLEIACRSDNTNFNILNLWLKLEKKGISKLILDKAIKGITNGNKEILPLLIERIGETNLLSYLRFCALNQSTISDSAAIILYKYYNEKNLTLIGEPIILKTLWFDYKSLDRDKILNDLIYKNDNEGITFVINHIPIAPDDFGISEIYIKYFLNCIANSPLLFRNEFFHVVRYLGKFTLSRYPEIRELFIKTINRSEYYDMLQSMLGDLDRILRYNAASILLVSFPESESDALEVIIRSSFKELSDNQEWFRFCMKLNYSKKMLDFIFNLLDDLTEISRIFAIKLLYHNNEYKLNNILLDELLNGLIGKARFLDSSIFKDDGIEKITAQDKYFDIIKSKFDKKNHESIQYATSILIEYHFQKLNISEKAKCWLFNIQYSDYFILDFHRNYISLLDDIEFITELKKHAFENTYLIEGKQFLLLKYYEVIKEDGNWKDFFLTLLNNGLYHSHDRLEHLYEIFIDIGKSNPKIGERLGQGVKELMTYPLYNQDKIYNYILPHFAILAHEFGTIEEAELNKIIVEYKITHNETACSLLFRLSYIPQNYYCDNTFRTQIAIFTDYKKILKPQYNKEGIEKLLIDGDDIPENLSEAIDFVLIYGLYKNDELITIARNGNLSLYFAIVVSFSRITNLGLRDFLKAGEIGSFNYVAKDRTQYHKAILLKIKNIVLTDQTERDNYIETLIQSINFRKPADIIDVFIECFSLNTSFEPKLLPKLFIALLEVPYRLNLNLVYSIFEYIINHTSDDNRNELIVPLKLCLKDVLSFGNDRHINEFELMTWTLSLILLFIEGKTSEDTENGFLIGLKNVFIQDGNNYSGDFSKLKFKGRDIFVYSNLILTQIDSTLIKYILEKGIKSNVPEVSSICKLISAFNN